MKDIIKSIIALGLLTLKGQIKSESAAQCRRFLKGNLDIFINRCRSLRLLPEYIIAVIPQLFKQLPKNEKEAVFTFEDDRVFRDNDGSGRYAYLILNAFSEAGYNVYFLKDKSFSTYIYLRKYGRFIYQIKNLKFVSEPPLSTSHMVYLFDTVHMDILDKPWQKRTFVNIMKPNWCRLGDMMQIPYFMHPYLYQLKQPARIESLRNTNRTLRTIFGGNTAIYYNNPLIKRYNQMTREEGVQAALSYGEQVQVVKDHQQLDEIFSTKSYLNECRIIKTDSNVSIQSINWLDTIAHSDFFLCFVGTDVLMCHNVIEAMSVGTIPIISYPDWFSPRLEHKKNAILYTSKEDLLQKLDEVFAMSQIEIDRLRRGVIEYYHEHLGNQNFIKKYEAQNDKDNSIILYTPLIGTVEEDQAAQETLNLLEGYFGKSSSASKFSRVDKGPEFLKNHEEIQPAQVRDTINISTVKN